MYGVSVLKLFDGKLSVRIDDEEVALLPTKMECTPEDIERALIQMCLAVDEIWNDPEEMMHKLDLDLSW